MCDADSQKVSFLSWNVDGLRNKLHDPDFLKYVSRFDIVCLVETFLQKPFLAPDILSDFVCFSTPAVKLSHHGRCSGGVVVMVRKSLAGYVSKVECTIDHVVLLKINKSLFGTERDVVLVASYIPPTDSPYYRHSVRVYMSHACARTVC